MNQNLKIEKKTDGIYLSGTIDEMADLSSLTQTSSSPMILNLKNITRINSAGVRKWIKTATKFSDQTEYHECSESIIEQVNVISNFISKGTIISFCAPYQCAHCENESTVVFDVKKDVIIGPKSIHLQKIRCKACGGPMRFDEDEAAYLNFLRTDTSSSHEE